MFRWIETRADASIIGPVHDHTKARYLEEQMTARPSETNFHVDKTWPLSAASTFVRGESYLINGAPSPVLINFPKLGFHRWQTSCHSFVFFFPGHWHPLLRWNNRGCVLCRLATFPLRICNYIDYRVASRSRPTLAGNTPLAPPTRCSCRPPVAEKKRQKVF